MVVMGDASSPFPKLLWGCGETFGKILPCETALKREKKTLLRPWKNITIFAIQTTEEMPVFLHRVSISSLTRDALPSTVCRFPALNQSCFIMFSFPENKLPTMKSLDKKLYFAAIFLALINPTGNNETVLPPSQLTKNNTPIMPITVSNHNEPRNKISKQYHQNKTQIMIHFSLSDTS